MDYRPDIIREMAQLDRIYGTPDAAARAKHYGFPDLHDGEAQRIINSAPSWTVGDWCLLIGALMLGTGIGWAVTRGIAQAALDAVNVGSAF